MISLSERVLELVLNLIQDTGLHAQDLIQRGLAPLPANNCWLEYPPSKFGGKPFALYVQENHLVPGMPPEFALGTQTHWVQMLGWGQDDYGREGVISMAFFPRDGEGNPVPSASLIKAHSQRGAHPLVPYHENYTDAALTAAGLLIQTSALLAVRGATTVQTEVRREKRLSKRWGSAAVPKYEYRVVDVNLDIMGDHGDGGNGGGMGKALHHVRGHLRATEKKGLVAVRPHWRGSAALGLIRRDMNIKRDEEMH